MDPGLRRGDEESLASTMNALLREALAWRLFNWGRIGYNQERDMGNLRNLNLRRFAHSQSGQRPGTTDLLTLLKMTSHPNRSRWLLGLGLVGALALGLPVSAHAQLLNMAKLSGKAQVNGTETVRDADLIRVGISDDAMTAQEYPTAQITALGPFSVRDKATGSIIFSGKRGDIVTITVDARGFSVKAPNLPSPPPVTLAPSLMPLIQAPLPDLNVFSVPPQLVPLTPLQGPLMIQTLNPADWLKIMNITRRKENPQFRGVFEIVRASSSPAKLSIVNVLSLEDYLKAVVPNELPMRYGWEAVKAQAVAARNYAIRPREKPWKTFDICDSQLCQVYLGAQTETPDSNRAIGETEGLIGLYNSDPILALFSSSHGGFAEDYSNSFSDPLTKQYPAPSIPYLKGGPDVPFSETLDLRTEADARKFYIGNYPSYDVESPYYRWQKQWTLSELQTDVTRGLLAVSKDRTTQDFITPLFQPGNTLGEIRNIRVLERGYSGKAMIVALDTTRGTWTFKKEFLIRKVFGKDGKMLPSANLVFSLFRDPSGKHLTSIVVNGGGFGHGVGMSQLGASWMSKHGYPFQAIVQHYYKGVSLGSIPVAVGAGSMQPVITRFDAPVLDGMLWLQEGDSGVVTPYNTAPVHLRLNDQDLTLAPSGFRSGTPVKGYLHTGQINSLVLYPDIQHPERKLKAWIELFPAIPATPDPVAMP